MSDDDVGDSRCRNGVPSVHRSRLVGVLAALTMVAAGCAGPAGVTRAALRSAGAAAHDPVAQQRAVDALGASGTAGIDAVTAAAQTAQQKAALAGDIVFSTPSGTFQGEQSVRLSTSIANAQIHYTTDGTVPTSASPVYSAALTLTKTTQVRAQAFVGDAAS